jgi:peroxiredoxin
MKVKQLGALAVMSLLALCSQAQVSYKVSGTWTDGVGKKVYLIKWISKDNTQKIDSAVVDSKCAFLMKGKVNKMQKMTFNFGPKSQRSIYLDGQPITITIAPKTSTYKGKTSTNDEAVVKGSRQQQVLQSGEDLRMSAGMMQLGRMFSLVKVKDKGEAAIDSVSKMFDKVDSAVQAAIVAYVDSTRNDYASTCFISEYLIKNKPYDVVLKCYNNLTDRVKKSTAGIELKKEVQAMGTVNVGGMAPDIKLPTPEGKEFNLHALRGHIVLLDFWASWCGPCLRELPNVKAIYEKYHSKGLEILGVSLDEKKDAWVAAIAKNKMTWHHVSSLKGWKCPAAALYNVTGIPRMYILDKTGKIIAQDLRGEALANKMAELFSK